MKCYNNPKDQNLLVNSFVTNENIRKPYSFLTFLRGQSKGTLGTNGLIQQLNAPDLLKQPKKENLTKLSAQLEDPKTVPKTYCSILKRFLSHKKVPNTPRIFVNGKFVSKFSEKSELFNSYFDYQYTRIVNNSKLPSLEFKTNQRLQNKTFTDGDINFITKSLNVDKAHGWDSISFRMIKL